ncbi:MAG: hypothetical protein ABSE86_10610 [Bryobacteraceae bacterium]|jgi:uncharacterized protein (TIGR03437 family)
MTYHRGIASAIHARRKELALPLPPLRAVVVTLFALALLARFAAAQSTTVTVNATQGPWLPSLNPSFNYGDGTNAAPTAVDASNGIPFNPGGTVTVTYVSGLVNVYPEGGFTATDANGYSGDATNNMVLANGSYPSYFISSSSYPVYASELIGAFANNGVIVGNPFPIGDGPKSFTIPSGANQLLLGVDDNDYSDNTGSWQIKVTYAPATGSTTGNPACYQFSGSGATLEIDITSFVSKQDGPVTSSGYTSRDTFQGNNSLTLGGSTKTSISTSNTPDCVGCLLGSAVFSYDSSTDLTVFTMTVPADDTPGDGNGWFVTLGGAGNLIPSGVLPQSPNFPPISSWAVNSQITVGNGANITSYPVTSITSCSLGGNPPSFTASGVVNGASFAKGGIVPGEIATLFGSNLTSSTGINLTSGLPLVTTFLNVSVMVNDKAAPLFAVDDVNGQEQINFQVPWEVASGPTANIAVTNNGTASVTISVPVLAAQPGIINYNTAAGDFGVILHSNFQLADSAHPATTDETVLIYCTGLGAVSSPPADGVAANGQSTVAIPNVTIGGVNAKVSFSGLAPEFVGLYQVNAVVPPGLASGNQPVVITVGGSSSNSALLPIQ